jgi:outer membrane protein assembly factor BamB
MKKLLAFLVLAGGIAATAASQATPVRVYTTPRLPPQEVLDRLSLTLAWSTRLPTNGSEDGLFSVQLLGREDREEILVQSRAGVVFLLDAATGDVLWHNPVGRPYQLMFPAAWNDENIYVTRHEDLFALNRRNGRHRLYLVDAKERKLRYGYDLGNVPSAAPAADEDQIYLCMGDQLRSFVMPRFHVLEGAPKEGAPTPPEKAPGASSHQPILYWNHLTEALPLTFPPVPVEDTVSVLSAEGTLHVIYNGSVKKDLGKALYTMRLCGQVAAPMTRHGNLLYAASEDHRVYAFDVEAGKLRWVFRAGAPVALQLAVTDRDVYVAAKWRGLYRVDRDTGEPIWLNKRGVHFLAKNQKFAYALDRAGKLLILDQARGTTLTEYDLSGYTVPVSNERTDRIFLGAHDGSLICLHHRSNRTPYRVRALPGPKEEPKKDKGVEMKEEKKKDEVKKKEKKKGEDDLKKDEKKNDKEDLKKEENKKQDLKKDKDAGKAKDADKAGQAAFGTSPTLVRGLGHCPGDVHDRPPDAQVAWWGLPKRETEGRIFNPAATSALAARRFCKLFQG